MNFRNKTFLLASLFVGVFMVHVYGQDKNISKISSKAEKLFQVKNYDEALPLYLELSEGGAEVDDLDYKIGKCFVEMSEINDRIKAIPYLEKVESSGIEEYPYRFYEDMGDVYYQNEQMEQALLAYEKHIKILGTDQRAIELIKKKIETVNNAFKIMQNPRDVYIERLGDNVNSEYTEYNPVVSADEEIMAFTSLRPNTTTSRTGDKFVEEIYLSRNETGSWSIPEKVTIQTENNYGTAGISADGHEMLIFIGDQNSGGIYSIEKEGKGWSRPVSLGTNINSKYLETTASITPDGKEIYFASNRPGGYGGMDIYKSVRKEDGTWGVPVNLGKNINSRDDEDAPFIHPNKTYLFFTSNGHKTMGGYDIFRSELKNDVWSKPVNMGYPVNSPANDNYFTLIADGSGGYFSSDRKGGKGGQDIYRMDMPEDFETIPLTMIKGRILEAETERPLDTKIYMIDNETKEKLDYVYHPNKETGDYLVILPPNKNYDMIIESDGFLPYTLNIDVPNQTEFYELYQKIYLKTIRHFDVIVGQEVEVKNAFYNTHEDKVKDLRQEHEAALIEHDSIDVFELMGDLIEAGDQEAIDYIIELMMIKDPIDDVDFSDGKAVQEAKRTYFYDESDESKFEKKEVEDMVIYSLPTMFVTEEAEAQKQKEQEETKISYDPALLEKLVVIYFDADQSELEIDYHDQLDDVLDVLNSNNQLGVEISGFASSEGNEEYNKKLSNQRAISVLDYLNHRGIVRRRIIAKGYGSTENEGVSKEKSRRVEVRVVDVNKISE